MKNAIVPLIFVATIIAAATFWMTRSPKTQVASSPSTPAVTASTSGAGPSKSVASPVAPIKISVGGISPSGEAEIEVTEDMPAVRPAGEAYASAQEALDAVLKGSKDYDDSILEQFTQPGPECSWCPEFYDSVRDKATSSSTPQEQRAYLAEILAISGKIENIQTLTESIKTARSNDEADLYAEALELSLGNDDVVRYLGDQMASPNDTLREASVAALTNQGSLESLEILAKHTRERGDPDGYYSQGIGISESIPRPEALPFVQENIRLRDEYSPGFVRSALNAGMPGIEIVFAELEGSTNPEADRALLKDALEHVSLEDGLREYVDGVIQRNRSPVAVEFATKIKNEFTQQENETDDAS
jgi:hypothetical protein